MVPSGIDNPGRETGDEGQAVHISVDPPSTSSQADSEDGTGGDILATSIGNGLPDIDDPRVNRILNILNDVPSSSHSVEVEAISRV